MMILELLALLIGIALGQRFTVLILVPAIALALLGAGGTAIAHLVATWTLALITVAWITSLQIGYLAGAGIHNLVASLRASRLRGAWVAPSPPTQRTAQ
jgi:hypothetical protein